MCVAGSGTGSGFSNERNHRVASVKASSGGLPICCCVCSMMFWAGGDRCWIPGLNVGEELFTRHVGFTVIVWRIFDCLFGFRDWKGSPRCFVGIAGSSDR